MPSSPRFIQAALNFRGLGTDWISNNFREIMYWQGRNRPWVIKVGLLTSSAQSDNNATFVVGFDTLIYSSYSPQNPNPVTGSGLIWTPSTVGGGEKYGTLQVPQFGAYQVHATVTFKDTIAYSGQAFLNQNATVAISGSGSNTGNTIPANAIYSSVLSDVVICNPGDTLAINAAVTGTVANPVNIPAAQGFTQWTIRYLGIL